jgi:hypothetical protein
MKVEPQERLQKPVDLCVTDGHTVIQPPGTDISHWIEEYYGSGREKLLSEGMKDIPECCTVVLVIPFQTISTDWG